MAEYEAVQRPTLTKRELTVLQMAADGENCESSALILHLSIGYLKHIRHRAILKLGADNSAHAVAQALRRGLIQ